MHKSEVVFKYCIFKLNHCASVLFRKRCFNSNQPVYPQILHYSNELTCLNWSHRYTSKPAASLRDGDHQLSTSLKDVYAILLKWPDDLSRPLILGDPVPTDATEVSLLGYAGPVFPWIHHVGSGLEISIPNIPAAHMPCQWAWVFKLTNIYNWEIFSETKLIDIYTRANSIVSLSMFPV